MPLRFLISLSRNVALITLLATAWLQVSFLEVNSARPLHVGTVPANYVIDQQYDPATTGVNYNLVEQHPIGQEFIPEFSNIIAVHVQIQGTSQARIRLNIIQGNISAVVVATTARILAPADSGWALFDLGAATIIPDNTYVIQLIAEQGTGWTWASNQQPVVNNPYHRGRIILLGLPGENDDLHFITYSLAPTQTTTITQTTNVTLVNTVTAIETQTATQTATLTQTRTEVLNRTQTVTAEVLTTIRATVTTKETTTVLTSIVRTETSVTTRETTITSQVSEAPGINTALLIVVAGMLAVVIWGQFLRARQVAYSIQP